MASGAPWLVAPARAASSNATYAIWRARCQWVASTASRPSSSSGGAARANSSRAAPRLRAGAARTVARDGRKRARRGRRMARQCAPPGRWRRLWQLRLDETGHLLVDRGGILLGHRPRRCEQAGAIDGIEFVRLAAEIARHPHAALFGQDIVDFALAQGAQHAGHAFPRAWAVPAHRGRVEG